MRAEFPESTLADLYDPLAMPAKLVKAHAALDRAVDRCYRTQPFGSDRQRVEFLFALYEQMHDRTGQQDNAGAQFPIKQCKQASR